MFGYVFYTRQIFSMHYVSVNDTVCYRELEVLLLCGELSFVTVCQVTGIC